MKPGKGHNRTLAHEELTGQIIGAAIEVHKTLGPGFLEAIYENALAIELKTCRDLADARLASSMGSS